MRRLGIVLALISWCPSVWAGCSWATATTVDVSLAEPTSITLRRFRNSLTDTLVTQMLVEFQLLDATAELVCQDSKDVWGNLTSGQQTTATNIINTIRTILGNQYGVTVTNP